MEVIGHVGDRRRAGEQRHDDQPRDLAPAPQRNARAEWRVGSTAHPRQPLLITGNQRQRRGERHLKARMNDRLGRDEEHAERRHHERPQRERLAINHYADEDNGDHDEGTLRRHFGAREKQIERRSAQSRKRRPFLDRMPAGERPHQRERRAQYEEDDAGHQRHVIAGDRQDVADARSVHGVEHRRG
jgi:hypothetical protein